MSREAAQMFGCTLFRALRRGERLWLILERDGPRRYDPDTGAALAAA
jgi:hypothetical protein